MDTPPVGDYTELSRRLPYRLYFGYGVGHVLNDICASLWFTYLLVYFHLVLGFSSAQAGVVLLVGQVADALATPFVGYHSDKVDDFWLCRYGRRKTWHLLGTLCTVGAFPFIFSPCVGCQGAHPWAQLFYYCGFVCIFQFGWAAVQISHLALIPELTPNEHDRTKLTAVRYSFTVFSSVLVYGVTWALLKSPTPTPEMHNIQSSITNSTIYDYRLINSILLYNHEEVEEKELGKQVGPDDAVNFQQVVLIGLAVGGVASLLFHVLVQENSHRQGGIRRRVMLSRSVPELLQDRRMYQVAGMYMCTRLFVNLTQVFTPLYLHETLLMAAQSLAIVPLVMFLSSLITSPLIQPINKLLGRKFAYIIGAALGIAACVWGRFGKGDFFIEYCIYAVAALFGAGGSIMLVTSLGVTADFIGQDTDSSAVVYGLMSFTDKLSNGLAVIIIQNLQKSFPGSEFYRDVLTYVCGGSAALGVFCLAFLTKPKSSTPYNILDNTPSGSNAQSGLEHIDAVEPTAADAT